MMLIEAAASLTSLSVIIIAAIKQRMEEALSSKDTDRAGWMFERLATEQSFG
jgi:hypothetical protein